MGESMAEFEIYRREKKYHIHEIILKWIVDIIMVVCLSFVLATYMLGKTTVVGHSMEPTLENADSLLIDKVSYCFKEPERYDVVVFVPNIANVSKYYVKRIVGLPGETVQIIDGLVYINGEPLEDDVIYSFDLKDEDGNEISVDIYWPTDDQIAQLKSLIDSLDTPSYGDYTILSTILKDSINAIIGDTSVDDAVEQVVKDINIYLSE